MAENELDPFTKPDPMLEEAGFNRWQRLRNDAYKEGLVDPTTGLPTNKGLIKAGEATADVARMWAEGMSPGNLIGGGAMGIIAGRNARNANMLNAAKAAEMAGEVKNPENALDVWNKTGWFKGPDGKWKWEIPDTEAKLNPAPDSVRSSPPQAQTTSFLTLGEILDHPELYKNYPELAKIPIKPLVGPGALGAYAGGKNPVIYMGGAKPGDYRSTLLHEIQHGVQDIEGFARGGNPNEFLPPGYFVAYNNEKAMREVLSNMLPKTPEAPANFNWDDLTGALEKRQKGVKIDRSTEPLFYKEYLEHLKYFDSFSNELKKDVNEHIFNFGRLRKKVFQTEDAAFEKYQQLAGEVEARNVQERAAQGDYTSHPMQTEGYPTYPQIVKFYNGRNAQLIPIVHDPFQVPK